MLWRDENTELYSVAVPDYGVRFCNLPVDGGHSGL